eukprot:2912083-Pleurochrysis_carterae.AAC.1
MATMLRTAASSDCAPRESRRLTSAAETTNSALHAGATTAALCRDGNDGEALQHAAATAALCTQRRQRRAVNDGDAACKRQTQPC